MRPADLRHVTGVLLCPLVAPALVTAGCATSALGRPAREFRVATWNVLWENTDCAGVASVIRDLSADVVCLQEVTPQLEQALRKNLAGQYAHMIFRSRCDWGDGYALLSRHEIEAKKNLPNPGSGPPACWAELLTPMGRVQVLNLHLTYPQVLSGSLVDRFGSYTRTAATRLAEVRHFSAALKPGVPAVVAGDFNSFEDEPSVDYLTTKAGLVDAYRRLYPQRSPADVTWWRDGDRASLMKARIDYVLASPELVPVAAEVVPCGLSDHRPVIAVFRLSAAPAGQSHGH